MEIEYFDKNLHFEENLLSLDENMIKQMHLEHRKGRPSTSEQTQIKKTLRSCYHEGLSAFYTAEKTRINIKTVCKYFNEWSEEIEEIESANFLERQKRDRVQVINSYDFQIDEATKLLSQVNSEIENNYKEKKSMPRHLFSNKLEVMKFRSSLVEKKAGFIMQPTMDEAMEKKIKEQIEQHDNTREHS
jgi:hypothetical protein